MTGTPCQRAGVEMSLDTARRSACATSATNLAPHGSCSFLIDSGKPGDIRRSETHLDAFCAHDNSSLPSTGRRDESRRGTHECARHTMRTSGSGTIKLPLLER